MRAYPLDVHIILCPRCKREIETKVWRDGNTMHYQCPRCRYYGDVTKDDFMEDDKE